MANGCVRRKRAIAGFLSIIVALALAAACADPNPAVPRAALGGSGPSPAPALLPPAAVGAPSPVTTLPPQASAPPVGADAAAAAAPGDRPITPPPGPLPAPAAPATPPPVIQAAGATPAGGTWAVVIGIDKYGGGYNLESAVNDANDMTAALQGMGVPSDHMLVLLNSQATAGTIRASADWLVAHAGADSNAVFFYAGHSEKLTSSTEALVGADGGEVTDADLAGHFSRLAAHRAWFVIAACYAGGFDELLGPGRILTAAADANHLAYENESFRRSYLVQYMIRYAFLEGRAPSSVQSAFNYAVAALHHDYPGREPMEIDDLGTPLDLRTPAAVSRQPTPTSAPPTPTAPPTPPPTAPPSTTPPNDACGALTLGMVRCGS